MTEPTKAQWRERAIAAERALELAASVGNRPPVDPIGPREDITSGNVWPDAEDPEYVAWLAQRVKDLESVLRTCEELLGRYERWGAAALESMDDVVRRLIVEEHGPPPRRPRSS